MNSHAITDQLQEKCSLLLLASMVSLLLLRPSTSPVLRMLKRQRQLIMEGVLRANAEEGESDGEVK